MEIIRIRVEINEVENKKATENINKVKSQLFENKIDRSLARLTKWKRENTQSTTIRKEIGAITTNLTEVKWLLTGCYEQLSVNQLDNLDEMEKF